jgi:hypothetical protein
MRGAARHCHFGVAPHREYFVAATASIFGALCGGNRNIPSSSLFSGPVLCVATRDPLSFWFALVYIIANKSIKSCGNDLNDGDLVSTASTTLIEDY